VGGGGNCKVIHNDVYFVIAIAEALSLLEAVLEGKGEQAANDEEGSRRHAGANGGGGTRVVRCLTSRVVGAGVGRTVDELGESDKVLEFFVRGRTLIAVHSEDHAAAAVVRLSAVRPDGLRVVDSDGEGLGSGRGSIDGLEVRIETGPFSELLARRTERRLGNGVVLRDELENDRVADIGSDPGGVEGKGTIFTDFDAMLNAFIGDRGRIGRVGVRLIGGGPSFTLEGNSFGYRRVPFRGIGLTPVDLGGRGSRPRGPSGGFLLFLGTKRQCSGLEVVEGFFTCGGAVDRKDHSLSTVAGLLAVKPDWL
jgi:hypothetical protein